jgi:hypothetical protein
MLMAACANPVGWDSLEGTGEWVSARAAYALEVGAMTPRCERAPLVHYVEPGEFRDRCSRDPCSAGRPGACAHACAGYVGGEPVVIADVGEGPDYGPWVLVHESLHVLARCTRLHVDGDPSHVDARLWDLVFNRAMRMTTEAAASE